MRGGGGSERRGPSGASQAQRTSAKRWLIGGILGLALTLIVVSQTEILSSAPRDDKVPISFIKGHSSEFDALDNDKQPHPQPAHAPEVQNNKDKDKEEEEETTVMKQVQEDFQLPAQQQAEIFEEEVKEIQGEKGDFEFKEEDNPINLEALQEDLTNPAIEMSKGFLVTFPSSHQECFESLVIIETTNEEILTKWDQVSLFLGCGMTPHVLPFGPLYDNPKGVWRFGAKFFPDSACMNFTLSVQSTDTSIHIYRGHETSFISLPYTYDNRHIRHLCWDCAAVLENTNPRGYMFGLADEKSHWITKENEPIIKAGETLRLWIKPLPQIAHHIQSYLPHLSWNAWMTNEKIFRHARVAITLDKAHEGYEITLSSRDIGTFDLHVTLNFINGLNEVTESDPILVSSHMTHYHSSCNENRASVYQPIKVHVIESPEMIDLSKKNDRCMGEKAMGDGRWVFFPLDSECEPPFCTGDRFPTLVSAMSWQGHRYPYVWLPYDCYLHYYTLEDYEYCSKRKDIKWIHTFGDSLVREIPAYLMSIYGIGDLSKFHLVDQMLNDTITRITFFAWGDIMPNKPSGDELFAPGPEHFRDISFTKWLMEHFNILSHTTPASTVRLTTLVGWEPEMTKVDEEGSPDVLLMNPNMAYVLYLQSEEAWHRYINDLSKLVKKEFTNSHRKVKKMLWYGQPHVFGPAHEGTPHLTEARNRLFSEWARPLIEEMGFVYLDTDRMTASRPEEAWDGLHFLRTGTAIWTGHVSASIGQLILNYVFEDCTSQH